MLFERQEFVTVSYMKAAFMTYEIPKSASFFHEAGLEMTISA
jgi:hypothetical protein